MAKKTEWKVQDRDGDVTIRVRGDRIDVRWLCGGSRSFSTDDLEAAIERADRMHDVGVDVWAEEHDTSTCRFDMKVVDGRLYANDPGSRDVGLSVRWDGRQGFKYKAESAIKAARPGAVRRALAGAKA